MRKIFLIFLFLLSLTSLCFAASYTFVPGSGITNLVYIDNKLDNVITVMGKPGTSFQGWRGKHYLFPKYQVELVVNFEAVEGIIIKSTYYVSQEGIKIGSTLDQVVATYGTGYSQIAGEEKTEFKTIFYEEKGVAFDIRNSTGKVTRIYLMKANTPFNYK